MWTREETLDYAEQLAELADGMRNRSRPADADAATIEEVSVAMALKATAPGDWPIEVVGSGTAHGWAARLSGCAHHLDVSTDLHATASALRVMADQLRDHAANLRSTGAWEIPRPPPHGHHPADEAAVPDEVDPEATTRPHMKRDLIK